MIIQRLYTKVLLPGGSKDIKDLSDKQLENISKYGSTDTQKKNILKNGAKLTIASGVTGGGLGALLFGLNGKTATKGAAVGLAAGSGIALYGHHRNKKLAKEAREELEKRKKQKNYSDDENAKMTIQDIFIVGGKVVAIGKVERGTFRVGDKVKIDKKESTILEIRQFKKTLKEATKGMNIGILLDNINKNDIHRGMIIEK